MRKSPVTALVFSALLGLAAQARGDGVFYDNQGFYDEFIGCKSSTNTWTMGSSSGTDAGVGVAGLNWFSNHISPISITCDAGNGPYTFWAGCLTNFPTCPTGDAPLNTYLQLDGTITLSSPDAFVDIELTGGAGGSALVIDKNDAWTGTPTVDTFSLQTSGLQLSGGTAVESIVVEYGGDCSYVANGSPEFFGEVAEPASLLLLAAGLPSLALYAWRRRRRTA